MAGTYNAGEQKIRPGTYYRYENAGGITVADGINGVGAALFQSNWGPLGEVVELDLSFEPSDIYGTGLTSNLLTEMFKGGCVTIQAVRIGEGGTCCKVLLKDDSGMDILELAAKFPGDRTFSVTVRDSLYEEKRECIIYDGVREFEKISFLDGSVDTIVSAFSKSKNFTVKKLKDGTVADVVQAEMQGGTNPKVTIGDYSKGTAALESVRWNVLCVDTTDRAVHSLVAAYLERIEEEGHFPMACLAETAENDLQDRMKYAAAFNSEKICFVLNPVVDTSGQIYDGWLLAARIGGMIAAVPSNASLTHQVITDFAEPLEKLTNRQIEKALTKGCICLTVNPNNQVWIEYGINTLVTPKQNQDAGWKKIRRTKTRFELMDRTLRTMDPLIGKVNNDSDGRATIVAAGQSVINIMAAEKKLLPGGKIYEDSSNPAAGDSVWLAIDVDDIDSAEKIYLLFRYRFAPTST